MFKISFWRYYNPTRTLYWFSNKCRNIFYSKFKNFFF